MHFHSLSHDLQIVSSQRPLFQRGCLHVHFLPEFKPLQQGFNHLLGLLPEVPRFASDSRSRSASLKGASTVEAILAFPGSTFSRYLSAFLTATCATCMSNPKNFTFFGCFGSWFYLRIDRIMSRTSSVFQVQRYIVSRASAPVPVPF